MSPRYTLSDGSTVDTKNSTIQWGGSGENLHRSRKAHYFIEFLVEPAHVEWVSPEAAVRWLLANGYPATSEKFPRDLLKFVQEK